MFCNCMKLLLMLHKNDIKKEEFFVILCEVYLTTPVDLTPLAMKR